ncbi:aspartyl/asparaginyl beta-hydroxylase domain-containing protein [Sphingomonas alpina]|uniref:Aspartyl/asparaginyl beta-hydroxylase domain-containing protein n=1 Tax=Sphingomonas alpina TaxID=653931 RepID=A0A7H0LIB8_9SPHN|nr:aspartyl/asparaginyl beta-hydroxylase domain-containing protein [Sphingomonas alpina]QNQ09421.1 aspartyl/asparaginyl beta-hydroxylase domain-containing protein [Sphingomonas alpina]
MSLASLLGEADRALAAQDFTRAQKLLREAALAQPEDLSIFLKLAGVSRAIGQFGVALDAVHRALSLSPLDFTALLMRAGLLDRAGDPMAGEAWGHALAQKPDGQLPPQMAAVLAEGERRHAAWLDAREQRLEAAMAVAEQQADDEERKRIARFRSNALRRTRHFHSEPTHFHFPGLVEREFHPRTLFPWLAELEAETRIIVAELEAVMSAERAELVPYIQYADHLPLQQWRPLNHNADWTAIHLWKNGHKVEANSRHCPRTLELLERLPQPVIPGASPNAMFSLLAPRTQIPPHVGINNGRLVCHLPLVVPAGCWFRVGAERRHWQRGEAFIFDDTIEHEAANPTDQLRIVFICDIWHPDLSTIEREAIAALIAAEDGVSAVGL